MIFDANKILKTIEDDRNNIISQIKDALSALKTRSVELSKEPILTISDVGRVGDGIEKIKYHNLFLTDDNDVRVEWEGEDGDIFQDDIVLFSFNEIYDILRSVK